MKEFILTEEQLMELLVLAIKIGTDSPELVKMQCTIDDVVKGMIKNIK